MRGSQRLSVSGEAGRIAGRLMEKGAADGWPYSLQGSCGRGGRKWPGGAANGIARRVLERMMVAKVVVNGVAGDLPQMGPSARAPALVAPSPVAVARASGRPSRARVQQIRELIFAAAMAEFSERGFRGATIASIAERSGVSRMTVYKHAESKEQLLEKLSEFSSERLRMAIESAIDETLPCWEVLMATRRC